MDPAEAAAEPGGDADTASQPSDDGAPGAADPWQLPMFKGLDSLNDKKWHVAELCFRKVREFLEQVGLPQHYDKFVTAGLVGMQDFLRLDKLALQAIGVSDPQEVEAIVAASVSLVEDKSWGELAVFGHVKDLIFETWQGHQLVLSNLQMYKWAWDEKEGERNWETTASVLPTYEEKWSLTEEHRALYSRDGIWASAVGCDGMMLLWPCDSPEAEPPCVRAFQVHQNMASDYVMDWERMAAITCGGDCKINIYDFRADAIVGTIRNNTGQAHTQMFLTIDGSLQAGKVAVGTAEGIVKLADVAGERIVMEMKGHTDSIYQVRADWDHSAVVSASWDHTVSIYDIRAGKKVCSLRGHRHVINRMAVDFSQQLAMTVARSPEMFLWDLRNREAIKKYQTKTGPNDIVVDWGNMAAVTCSDDSLIQVWDLETGECRREFVTEADQHNVCIDVNWERNVALVGTVHCKVQLFDLSTGEKLKEFRKQRRCLTQCWIKQGA